VQGAAGPAGFRSIDALQGLRAVAALLVVVAHAISMPARLLGIGGAYQEYGDFAGVVGVKLFFVVSGFVMVLSHSGDFRRRGMPTRFLARRLGRILPLYWIMTLVVVAIAPSLPSAAEIVWSMLLVPHQKIGGPFGWPVYVLGWTLQYEMFFYLLFACALRFSRTVGLALLTGAIAMLVAASLSGILGSANVLAYLGLPISLHFVFGVAIGVARPWLVRRRWRPGFGVALALAIAATVAGCALAWPDASWTLAAQTGGAAATTLAVGICALSQEGSSAHPVARAARALGDATYSIYLTHVFAILLLVALATRLAWAVPLGAFVPLAILVSAAVGVAVYRWVERPLVRSAGAWLGQRPGIGGRRL
jgi:peptidoglycan/LPS O-acetylase OafA/YrhL